MARCGNGGGGLMMMMMMAMDEVRVVRVLAMAASSGWMGERQKQLGWKRVVLGAMGGIGKGDALPS